VNTTQQLEITHLEIKRIPTVTDILTFSWEEYANSHETREVERQEVQKALSCRSDRVFTYQCTECKETVYQLLGCNSRLCSRCGKRYNDQWAVSLSKAMFQVPHRHFVLSIPSQLWPYLKADRSLWKDYMDSAMDTCADYFPKIMHNPGIEPGVIVILHPFGKDMKFQPHLHIIVTEGGFDGKGRFVPKTFFPARPFSKTWQYHVLTNLRKAGVPNALISEMFAKYKGGFYVWVHRAGTIRKPKDVAKYIGRYVRHPAIANSRITGFDGKTVEFFYETDNKYNNDDGENAGIVTERHNIAMPVNDFIAALIQHIPGRQFKMVRYYGAYARRHKRVFKQYASQSSIASTVQDTIYMTGRKFKPICPNCGGYLVFCGYETIPPPGDFLHWQPRSDRMVEWLIRD